MTSALVSIVLIINELMASNLGMVMSPATNFDSWIELYNPTEQDILLDGMYLSDNQDNLTLWQMPEGMGVVPANGFKVVWLGSNNIKANQAPFALDCDGGTIFISDTEGQLLTSTTYPKAMSRTAFARTTDGGDKWGWTSTPTPEATNTTAKFANRRIDPPVVSVDSRIFKGSISVDVDIPEGSVLMYTTDGSVPMSASTGDDDADTWKDWIVNGDCEGDDASCLIGKDGDGNGKFSTHFVDGAGYNGSRGMKIHAVSNPANAWDTQLFVYTPGHVLMAGDKYHFRMKVRADKNARVSVQSHTTPSNYIHWQMLAGNYDITTKWQEIDYEGTVTAEQAGASGLMTIAFNLNEQWEENNFYFDDISWESAKGSGNAGTSYQSKDGHFSFSKTTNLCCRLFREGYLPSVPVTRSYIQTNNNYTIPVISIVGDQRYFSDAMWGIDTQGSNGIPGNGREEPCNWNMDWDRPVNFSYITTDGEMAFNQDVNVAVSGGWTRAAYPRSFKLKASKQFDGQNHLDYQFFQQKPYIRNSAILVRNGGNDTWENNSSRFMDPALQSIAQKANIDLDLQCYLPVIEYVNGQFRGVLNLREVNNKKFVEANHGYDDELIDMFENFEFKVGNSDVLDRIFELGARINEDGAYEELKQLLDIDEFTNYMAIELFLGSSDWPHNNVKAYRSQQDGRYRFVFFDLDFAFKNSDPFWDIYDHQTNPGYSDAPYMDFCIFFINLLNNDEYRKKFIDTYCVLAGSVYETDRVNAIVDELADRVRPMMQLDGGKTPDTSANKIKTEMLTRLSRMMECMRKFKPMQLSGVTSHQVELNADTEGATLYVNGIEVPYTEFKGVLFDPVVLEAKAPAGYQFAGWKKAATNVRKPISSGTAWKYYDKGALSGTSWRNTNFYDGSWASGASPLGYKTSGVKTTVGYGADSSNKNPATYFRKSFYLSELPTSKDLLSLSYRVDDGFVLYVNGTEAYRFNMPEGNITFNTFSSSYAEDVPLEGTIELSPSLFKSGTNVIAVEVHNNSATSSDLFWDAELTLTKSADGNTVYSEESIIDLPNESKFSLTASFTPLQADEIAAQGITPVRINEVSAKNETFVNEYWKKNDWVELYNTTDEPIDVEGMYLSDNPDKPKKYQISKDNSEASTIIPPHGFLIIWCDKLDPVTQLHASFKLAAEGGSVILTADDESWSDQITYQAHQPDETVGRYPDGAADVFLMNIPTIAKNNITSSYVTPVEQPDLPTGINDVFEMAENSGDGISIKPSTGQLLISSTTQGMLQLNIVNLSGQTITTAALTLDGNLVTYSTAELPVGIYVASANDNNGHKGICKFIVR